MTDDGPDAARGTLWPVWSREVKSTLRRARAPVALVAVTVMVPLADGGGNVPVLGTTTSGPRAVTTAVTPLGSVTWTGAPMASSCGCPGPAFGVGAVTVAVGIGTRPSCWTTPEASGGVGGLVVVVQPASAPSTTQGNKLVF